MRNVGYKTGAREIWEDADKVMAFRHVVAHNPVFFRIDSPGSSTVRIPSIKEFKDGSFPDYTLADLEDQIRKVDDVNQRLERYRPLIEDAVGVRINIEYT